MYNVSEIKRNLRKKKNEKNLRKKKKNEKVVPVVSS